MKERGGRFNFRFQKRLESLLMDILGFRVDLSPHVSDLEALLTDFSEGSDRENGAETFTGQTNGRLEALHPRNTLNQLTGREWMWFTKSVIRTSYPSIMGHDLRRKQGGNKPPQLMQHLIEFFTKPGECVLDPFAGAGGTLLGAQLANRQAVGIEINPAACEIYRQVCLQEALTPMPVLVGDCREILPTLGTDSFDFIATDPPYSIRLRQTMSGVEANTPYGRQNRKSSYVEYSDNPRDLSNLGSFDEFYQAMHLIGKELLRVLRPGRYAAVIIRDAYQDGEYKMAAYRVAEGWQRVGWKLKGDKIWYATGSRLRPYGYPYGYVPNIIHQHILIFRKERDGIP